MSPAQYKAKREQLGLTQAGLASLLGVTRETINRRESGEQPITHEAALAISSLRPAKTKKAAGTSNSSDPMKTNPALSALRHHVTGAIARGEAQAITEVPATPRLIAAAPTLLEALAGCADALREAGKDFAQANKLAVRPNLYELHERSARAAIAKARG